MNLLARISQALRPSDAALPPSSSFRPSLETLEGRLVPATIDLTTAGAAGAANGAVFMQASPQPTGSGVIHSFLRLQAHHGASVEQGYNTDARPLQFDEKTSHVFTRSLKLSDVPTVTLDGVGYKEFLLDINQSGANSKLSLDELRLFSADAPDLTGYDTSTNTLAGHGAVYDLDAGKDVDPGKDNSVLLDARLSHGSGSGDMYFYVPASVFPAINSPYVYLYSKFGGDAASNGGFEEWAVRSPSSAVAPSLSSLSGYVYQDNNNDRVFDGGDAGLQGIVVTLTGKNDLGQTINLTTTTDVNGSYTFLGLRAGTYTLSETAAAGFANVGTVNGTPDGTNSQPDVISAITLPAGVAGLNYDFGVPTSASGGGSSSSPIFS